MELSVKDLLVLPEFKEFYIISGHKGLDKIITNVSVMDAPDIHRWMVGGEFLITSGYILQNNINSLNDLISNLNAAGASAFGIKLDRFIKEIPQKVLDTSNNLGFPIIFIPYNFRYTEIIHPVLTEIIGKQTQKLLYTEKINLEFLNLTLSSQNLETIIKNLSRIIHRKVCYVDTYFDEIYISHADIDKTFYKKNIIDCQKNSYPIKFEQDEMGILQLGEYDENLTADPYEKIAIDYAIVAITLNLQRKLSNRQVDLKYKNIFIEDILLNNILSLEELQNRASVYTWEVDTKAIVFIADIDNFKILYNTEDKSNKELESMANKIFKKASLMFSQIYQDRLLYKAFSDSIVFILSIDTCVDEHTFYQTLVEQFNVLKKDIQAFFNHKLTIGVGTIKDTVSIYKSYDEAKKAVAMSRKVHGNGYSNFYKDMGIHVLLEQQSNTPFALEFINTHLSPILTYDSLYNAKLFETLSVIIKMDWNLKASSKILYLHYNSIKYRFKKIEELLHKDLSKAEERLHLILSIKLYEMQNNQ